MAPAEDVEAARPKAPAASSAAERLRAARMGKAAAPAKAPTPPTSAAAAKTAAPQPEGAEAESGEAHKQTVSQASAARAPGTAPLSHDDRVKALAERRAATAAAAPRATPQAAELTKTAKDPPAVIQPAAAHPSPVVQRPTAAGLDAALAAARGAQDTVAELQKLLKDKEASLERYERERASHAEVQVRASSEISSLNLRLQSYVSRAEAAEAGARDAETRDSQAALASFLSDLRSSVAVAWRDGMSPATRAAAVAPAAAVVFAKAPSLSVAATAALPAMLMLTATWPFSVSRSTAFVRACCYMTAIVATGSNIVAAAGLVAADYSAVVEAAMSDMSAALAASAGSDCRVACVAASFAEVVRVWHSGWAGSTWGAGGLNLTAVSAANCSCVRTLAPPLGGRWALLSSVLSVSESVE